jgi:rhamnulokinase
MDKLRYVAVDLGAGSCRVSLAQWNGTQASVHLAHRYPNGPVEREGHLWWQLDQLCQGAEESLDLASKLLTDAKRGVDSVGVDGWAVDYVRLDQSGKPIADPLCYRDQRTETAMPEVWRRIERDRLYELTGIQFLRFNTLYQLYTDLRDGLDPAALWLNAPEYLLYRLAGSDMNAAVAEYTNSTHTQLVNARTRNWCDEIFEKVGLGRAAHCAAGNAAWPPAWRHRGSGCLQGGASDCPCLPRYRGSSGRHSGCNIPMGIHQLRHVVAGRCSVG